MLFFKYLKWVPYFELVQAILPIDEFNRDFSLMNDYAQFSASSG